MLRTRTAAAGMILTVSLSAAGVGLAGAASAAPARPAGHVTKLKGYRTWPAAQKAAGFQLLEPTNTQRFTRRSRILVAPCRPRRHRHNAGHIQIIALYRHGKRPSFHMITYTQARSAAGCAGPFANRPGGGKVIAKVLVAGVTATLSKGHASLCIVGPRQSRCASVSILQLRWHKDGHSYRVGGIGVPRAPVIRFARSLAAVK